MGPSVSGSLPGEADRIDPRCRQITSLMLANHVTKEDVIRNSVQTEKQRLVALAVLLIDM